ncbi:MAG: TIGR03745 family integrating conjugative element membrane protein [Aquisalimonadaceae bacterium]
MLTFSLASLVRAQGLPTLEDPSRGTGSGIMETLRNYGYDILLLVALLVVASLFVGVCYHAYSTYSECAWEYRPRSATACGCKALVAPSTCWLRTPSNPRACNCRTPMRAP